jgi:hypothetical protein
MDREVAPQLIASNSAEMATEVEPNFSRSGNEVSIPEKSTFLSHFRRQTSERVFRDVRWGDE